MRKYNTVTNSLLASSGMAEQGIMLRAVRVCLIPDESPDASYIGRYSTQGGEWDINCYHGKFVGELERENPSLVFDVRRGTVPFFSPNIDEKEMLPGSEEYRELAMRLFKLMEALNKGEWSFVGLVAEAEVCYSLGNGDYRIETLTSSGIWGVESFDTDHLMTLAKEEMCDLVAHLGRFGVDVAKFSEKAGRALEAFKKDFC